MIKNLWNKLKSSKKGAGIVEYVLVLALIALIAAPTIMGLSKTWQKSVVKSADKMTTKTIGVVTLDQYIYPYTGSEITPTPTVIKNGTTLTAGTDYTVTYENNIQEGYATVIATGIGSYANRQSTTTFYISKEHTIDKMYMATTVSAVAGTTVTPKPEVYDTEGQKLTENIDYTLSYAGNVVPEVGKTTTAQVTATGMGETKGTISLSFSLTGLAEAEVTPTPVSSAAPTATASPEPSVSPTPTPVSNEDNISGNTVTFNGQDQILVNTNGDYNRISIGTTVQRQNTTYTTWQIGTAANLSRRDAGTYTFKYKLNDGNSVTVKTITGTIEKLDLSTVASTATIEFDDVYVNPVGPTTASAYLQLANGSVLVSSADNASEYDYTYEYSTDGKTWSSSAPDYSGTGLTSDITVYARITAGSSKNTTGSISTVYKYKIRKMPISELTITQIEELGYEGTGNTSDIETLAAAQNEGKISVSLNNTEVDMDTLVNDEKVTVAGITFTEGEKTAQYTISGSSKFFTGSNTVISGIELQKCLRFTYQVSGGSACTYILNSENTVIGSISEDEIIQKGTDGTYIYGIYDTDTNSYEVAFAKSGTLIIQAATISNETEKMICVGSGQAGSPGSVTKTKDVEEWGDIKEKSYDIYGGAGGSGGQIKSETTQIENIVGQVITVTIGETQNNTANYTGQTSIKSNSNTIVNAGSNNVQGTGGYAWTYEYAGWNEYNGRENSTYNYSYTAPKAASTTDQTQFDSMIFSRYIGSTGGTGIAYAYENTTLSSEYSNMKGGNEGGYTRIKYDGAETGGDGRFYGAGGGGGSYRFQNAQVSFSLSTAGASSGYQGIALLQSFNSQTEYKDKKIYEEEIFGGQVKLKQATATGSNIEVTWNPFYGASGYEIYWTIQGESGKWGNYEAQMDTKTSFTLSGIETGKTYTFTVRALDANGALISGYDQNGVAATK